MILSSNWMNWIIIKHNSFESSFDKNDQTILLVIIHYLIVPIMRNLLTTYIF